MYFSVVMFLWLIGSFWHNIFPYVVTTFAKIIADASLMSHILLVFTIYSLATSVNSIASFPLFTKCYPQFNRLLTELWIIFRSFSHFSPTVVKVIVENFSRDRYS